jgi:hypothetical protein
VAGRGAGGRSSANGCAAGPARRRGAGHSCLTAGHRARAAPRTSGRAGRQPSRGEEASSPQTPSSARPDRHGRPRTSAGAGGAVRDEPSGTPVVRPWRTVRHLLRRTERNACLARLGCCYGPLGGRPRDVPCVTLVPLGGEAVTRLLCAVKSALGGGRDSCGRSPANRSQADSPSLGSLPGRAAMDVPNGCRGWMRGRPVLAGMIASPTSCWASSRPFSRSKVITRPGPGRG